ncbi:hypothetical protein BV898_02381 [Hypsibius exemplaris]|uniref:G-protein coupled receptors family 1 profile domain-containing protein n=1 Tax=Hypsibius exemplaris TaxID=2072580 RepID=A0A1W0X8B3_HYPEX|nr:hypothetical protein BV898_02381 [Hypsibius exemplaris]
MTLVPLSDTVLVTLFGDRPFSPRFCQIWGAIVFLPFFASNWAHVLLVINRYVAATFPHHYRYFTAKLVLVTGIIVPWLISITENAFPFTG